MAELREINTEARRVPADHALKTFSIIPMTFEKKDDNMSSVGTRSIADDESVGKESA